MDSNHMAATAALIDILPVYVLVSEPFLEDLEKV